jgi:hypothetical protein
MDFSMLEKIYNEFDREFLTDRAIEWGFINDTRLIFIERMASNRGHLSNAGLNTKLGFLVENKVGDTLSRQIYPKLIELGCPKREWETVVQWLKDKVFPVWSKLKPRLWDKIWRLAQPSDRIEIQVASAGRILTAKPIAQSGIPKISIGSDVNYLIQLEKGQHLILLEKDGEGGISCLSPSPLSVFGVGEPLAREELLAVISNQKPNLSWLEEAMRDFLELDAMKLQELIVWIDDNDSCHLLRREFDIVL